MSWHRCTIIRQCKECEMPLVPGDRMWREPARRGVLSLMTRRSGVVEQPACYCEDCGSILEYEGA